MNVNLFRDGKPTVSEAYELYNKGLMYNRQINLDSTVKVNEDFYIGK